MADAALISVDWGTSNLRAFLLDPTGTVLAHGESRRGIANIGAHVDAGGFAAALSDAIGGWLNGGAVPVVMSGMIGSRQGWLEAPYVDVPAGLAGLAAALVRVPFDAADVFVVPGVKALAGDAADVMRGEEVQVFGAMARLATDHGRFVLPGTHSKWVEVEAGRIAHFATYMTGDVYAALRDHTILGALMAAGGESAESTGEAFRHGVRDGAREGSPGALLHRLFGVRTAGLFGRFEAAELPDYLSGLLIGAELGDQKRPQRKPVHLIAADALAARYRAAAETLGIEARAVPEDCVTDAHMAIARSAGVI